MLFSATLRLRCVFNLYSENTTYMYFALLIWYVFIVWSTFCNLFNNFWTWFAHFAFFAFCILTSVELHFAWIYNLKLLTTLLAWIISSVADQNCPYSIYYIYIYNILIQWQLFKFPGCIINPFNCHCCVLIGWCVSCDLCSVFWLVGVYHVTCVLID